MQKWTNNVEYSYVNNWASLFLFDMGERDKRNQRFTLINGSTTFAPYLKSLYLLLHIQKYYYYDLLMW